MTIQRDRFLLYVPTNGFNDVMVGMHHAIEYCIKYNRVLLFPCDLNKRYNVNFSDYFETIYTTEVDIIIDTAEIVEILQQEQLSYFPPVPINVSDLFSRSVEEFEYTFVQGKATVRSLHDNSRTHFITDNTLSGNHEENIVVYSQWKGGGKLGYYTFKKYFKLKRELALSCTDKVDRVPRPYICIQHRGTDLNFENELERILHENETIITRYDTIVVITDDVDIYTVLKNKFSNVICFTQFSDNGLPIHDFNSTVPDERRIADMFTDILLVTECDSYVSSMVGGFSTFLKMCHEEKYIIRDKFYI